MLLPLSLVAQTAPGGGADPLKPLQFLEGAWEAKAASDTGGTAGGPYQFRRELQGHILARHGVSTDCKAKADFDCDHSDLLYVFQDAPGQPLKAVYFDNEGHVIHYAVSLPTPTEVVFLSEPGPGPTFRLTYALKGARMFGKFQMQVPGQTEWRSYLEWSGEKR